jgi:sugar phosphate isomerase/epimerase
MRILYGHSWWGLQSLGWERMIAKIHNAGFDYAEVYIPDDPAETDCLMEALTKFNLPFIIHQFQASGSTIASFLDSYKNQLQLALSFKPLLINSHTGKDFFTYDQNCLLIEQANELSKDSGILIVHETHRGRCLCSAASTYMYLNTHDDLKINADFSHWCCVSESLLEEQETAVQLAVSRAYHIHARVGYAQGPQITDPRHKRWNHECNRFLGWWKKIVQERKAEGRDYLTITPEFGPMPYQGSEYESGKPIGDIFEINLYMRHWLKDQLKYEAI